MIRFCKSTVKENIWLGDANMANNRAENLIRGMQTFWNCVTENNSHKLLYTDFWPLYDILWLWPSVTQQIAKNLHKIYILFYEVSCLIVPYFHPMIIFLILRFFFPIKNYSTFNEALKNLVFHTYQQKVVPIAHTKICLSF